MRQTAAGNTNKANNKINPGVLQWLLFNGDPAARFAAIGNPDLAINDVNVHVLSGKATHAGVNSRRIASRFK